MEDVNDKRYAVEDYKYWMMYGSYTPCAGCAGI